MFLENTNPSNSISGTTGKPVYGEGYINMGLNGARHLTRKKSSALLEVPIHTQLYSSNMRISLFTV